MSHTQNFLIYKFENKLISIPLFLGTGVTSPSVGRFSVTSRCSIEAANEGGALVMENDLALSSSLLS